MMWFLLVVLLSFTFGMYVGDEEYGESIVGWGAKGHSMIAYAATKLVSNKTRMNMLPLLGNYSLYEIAPLPDKYCWVEGGIWSQDLHFLIAKTYPFDVERDCGENWCVYNSILNYTKRLNTSNPVCKPVYNPVIGNNPEPCPLEYLTHFVGDIHQPLHMNFVNMYPMGGNDVKVNATFSQWFPNGIDTNLHACWDKWMIYEYIWRNYGQEEFSWMKWSDEMIVELMQDDQTLFNVYTSDMNPKTWVNGSMVLCIGDVGKYHYVHEGISIINEAYYELNIPHIKIQLMKSIARLTKLLDQILGGM